MEGRSSQLASDLIGRVRREVSARASRNRFVDLLEAGGVPRERLAWLAGEQFHIVGSDQRSSEFVKSSETSGHLRALW